MIIGINSYNRVNGIEDKVVKIQAFLQKSVNCWCINHKDAWFAARDLVGGENHDWHDTPLDDLFCYYQGGDPSKDGYAFSEAGKAVGRLLKGILVEDKRIFESREGYTREYRWTGEE